MAKIHITLVGGQPAPVYNGIVATNPDDLVYVYFGKPRKFCFYCLKVNCLI